MKWWWFSYSWINRGELYRIEDTITSFHPLVAVQRMNAAEKQRNTGSRFSLLSFQQVDEETAKLHCDWEWRSKQDQF